MGVDATRKGFIPLVVAEVDTTVVEEGEHFYCYAQSMAFYICGLFVALNLLIHSKPLTYRSATLEVDGGGAGGSSYGGGCDAMTYRTYSGLSLTTWDKFRTRCLLYFICLDSQLGYHFAISREVGFFFFLF